jgi:hypothetical protein
MEVARTIPAGGEINVSQTINLGVHYIDAGKPGQALQAMRDLECSGNVTDYGCVSLHMARYRAHLALGNQTEAREALAYLRAKRSEFEQTWADAALEAGDLDAAADLLIQQLKDPEQRGSALENVQDYLPLPMTPVMRMAEERWQQVLSRPDVVAALEAVGRRGKVPIYRTPN